MRINRRHALLGGLASSLGATLGGLPAAAQQDITFFRIGTGGTAGTYFPIGGLIANAISNPPGSRACADGGSCGVPGLVATAVASNGSVANVAGIATRQHAIGLRAVGRGLLGLERHRHLRGPAQGRRAARHRQPLSRELPPGGAQGRRHQVDPGPQGQAHVARRAGLGHAGRCPPDLGGLRHDGKGHHGRVPEAAAVGRQVQGRRARRVLQRRPAGPRARSPSSRRRPASTSCRSTGRKSRS